MVSSFISASLTVHDPWEKLAFEAAGDGVDVRTGLSHAWRRWIPLWPPSWIPTPARRIVGSCGGRGGERVIGAEIAMKNE
ncbi:MAG: hypothetical protein Q6365_012635 [Candidatus Sigynarchaeota archaeon]